jgi:uncharacterized protein (TIGR02246 family)
MDDRISSTSASPFGGAASPGGLERATVEAWVAAYRRAWISNDPAGIGALFTDDAEYLPTPWSALWSGRETIVRRWLERRDEPGTWTFESEVLAAEGDLGLVRGETTYLATADDPEARYANLWLIRFVPDGRARRFEEWWVLRSDVADADASGGEGD